ncbi:MAG: DUF4340 domain-containing protein [Dehalococcoidales bacterium]|nr:DUF4340 domain-containing protein [Dehalococcoidales bacterium]
MRIRNIVILLVILLALGGYFIFFNNTDPPPEEESKTFVWSIDIDEIQHVIIELPQENQSEAFVKIVEGDQFPWYFDNPEKSKVDSDRWGGGIPLLLSGPGVEKIVAQDATAEQLTEFGLTQPQMRITLTLTNENIMNITVGNKTPTENTYYIQVPNTNDVVLVDYTWYDVLERLVTEPPYASSDTD